MNWKFISPAIKITGKRKIIRGKSNFKKKLGQVWIETVIYTLIAFVMIGLVLAYAQPKIQQMQDQSILQQSTSMLKQIDSMILGMGTTGNQRVIEIGIKAGMLKLDCAEEKIIFQLDTKNQYSEPGKVIDDGEVKILTEKRSGYNTVTLTLSYGENYNLQFGGKNDVKTLSKASTSYRLSISNDGPDSAGKIVLNMTV
jgi:type II secretory pathway pseudopilin PulG